MHSLYSKSTFLLMALLINWSSLFGARSIQVQRIEPSSWWIGFKESVVQVMVYGHQIASTRPELSYPGVKIRQIIAVGNPNYLFIDLEIDKKTEPGMVQILFKQNEKIRTTANFELLARSQGSSQREGFNQSDAIYLIMPDRFANGNPENDLIPGMQEKPNRNEPYGRHGGDLEGIKNHLDYIKEMGFTSIWLNPVLENDQPQSSYHGYAITDFYNIDRRLGSNQEFKELVDACRVRGLKMIMDMVFNHCGSEHWWMKDLPSTDWLNQFSEFTRSNYRLSTVRSIRFSSRSRSDHTRLVRYYHARYEPSKPART